jgi:uncharacterized delta-60 repeat protein
MSMSPFDSRVSQKTSKFDSNIFELQPLEIRKLLTTAAIEAGALLHIIGTGSADTIQVNLNGSNRVTVTGVGTTFNPASITQILIEAGGGGDTVQIFNGVNYSESTITGNAGNDSITGGKATDYIFGAADNDNLNGGVGNDWIDGNSGNDVMIGGDGFDTSNYSDRGSAVHVTLDGAANDGEVSVGEADNVQTEEVLGGAGNDALTGSNTASDYLSGGGGADAITGNGGNDELTGGSGGDNLQGGQGDDYLHAQNNDRDTVNGGTGPGTTDNDLAEIDGLDVSGLSAGLNADIPNQGAISSNPADLDSTYGAGGRVSDTTLNFEPNGTAIDSQGRVIYVGTLGNHNIPGLGYGNEMVVVRYNADGTRDTTFAGNGEALIDFSDLVGSGYNDDDEALGVVIGSGDSIFVLGSTRPATGGQSDSAVAKLNSGGNRDSLWGSNGRAIVDASGDSFSDDAYGGVQQADGKLVVLGEAGSEGTTPRLFRLTATGQLDIADSVTGGGFSGDGIITDVNMAHAGAVALQNLTVDEGAQRVVVAGSNNTGAMVLERFMPDGSVDTSFGTAGTATKLFDGATSFGTSVNGMVIDSSNNIIIAGSISNFSIGLTTGVPTPQQDTSEAVLAKFTPSGGFTAAASHNGIVTGHSAFFNAVTIDAQGRYVVAGEETDQNFNGDFLIARVNSDMTPDNTFGLGGVTTTDFGPGYSDSAVAVRVLGNGKILASGTSLATVIESTVTLPAIARYVGNNPVGGENDVTEVEGFTNYDELHQQPPSPRMQEIFNRISGIAKNNLLWQPNDQGIVHIELDDKNNTVKFGTITTGDGKLNVTVNVDGILTEYYDPTTTKEIQIFAKGGNDLILANNSVTIPLLIDAGAGNDVVVAGAGNDIVYGGGGLDAVNGNNGNDAILGGAGSDLLFGDGGRDIIIGGADADAISGGADDDIQIAGTSSYDNDTPANVTALKAIVQEWGSGTPVAQRITHIRSGIGGLNGTNVLRGSGAGSTVFNDGVIDVLTNDAGNDWFFAHTVGAGPKDTILFGLGGETKDEI